MGLFWQTLGVDDVTDIKSPCIGVCKIEDRVCLGCHRTIAEIKTWNNLNDAAKQCVLGQASERNEVKE